MKSLRSFAAAALALLSLTVPLAAQPTRAEAEKDPVLKAMLAELDRSAQHLQLPGFAKPYFIAYRIVDIDEFSTQAAFGARQEMQRIHQRVAIVSLRIGDRHLDNSSPRGEVAVDLAALDNDPLALRTALWSATDQAYKAALATYAQKQAALKQLQTPPQADDFSQEKPLVSLASPARLALGDGPEGWARRMEQASALYRDAEKSALSGGIVQSADAAFRARALTTWIVTSEGSIVRKATTAYQESFSASTQANDGMKLQRSYASTDSTLAALDSPESFNRHAAQLLATLGDLRKAPLVEEEYHGPILFSSDAGADVVQALLASGLAAARPKLGTEARTTGAFASSFHARILPDFLDLVDDPSLTSFHGKGLLGAYAIDDEAIPAESVKLVEAGRLENYLLGRQPVKDFPHSNGHGRANVAGAPHPSIGVFKLTSREALSDQDLDKKLLTLAQERGLDHVYFIQTLGGLRSPRLLYRVAADGRRTLVRGAKLDDLDQRALRSSLVAAGRDLFVANYFEEIPVSVLAPSLLFDDATLRRANEKNDKLPFYPPPQ